VFWELSPKAQDLRKLFVCFKILLSCVMCKIFQILLNKIFLSTAASIRPYNHIDLQSFELCNVIYYHTGFIT
jgi:hypothetical protein